MLGRGAVHPASVSAGVREHTALLVRHALSCFIMLYHAQMKACARSLGFYAACLSACASEPVEYVELGEVCGGPSPRRVLELGPDELVRAFETLRVQDRVFYVVSRFDESRADVPYSLTAESTVWAVGPCGEAPVEVAAGIEHIFTLEIWPDVALGCEKATGNVVVLDPTGAAAPHVVFPGASLNWQGCGLNWTDFGLLSLEEHDEEFGALTLYPYPADPRTETAVPEVLLDPIRVGPSRSSGPGFLGNVLFSYPDEALALTPEDLLVRVDLADGAVTTVQTAVAGFEASRDGAYLLWQDAAITGGDAEHPEGKVFLRDRSAGSDILLGETSLQFSALPLWRIESGLVELSLGEYANDPKRVFFLPSFNFVEIPGDLHLSFQLPDGRWVIVSIFGVYPEAIDLSSGERTRLFPREAKVVGHDDEAVHVIEVPCCFESDSRDDGPMWRVPLDGSAMTKLADRATRDMERLDDGRLLGPVGVGAHWLGALVLVEPGTRDESRIDDHVHVHSIDQSRVNDEGIISYSVADGERSGVYLARLPLPAAGRSGAGIVQRRQGRGSSRD